MTCLYIYIYICTILGQHPVEVGIYQLLLNARSATGLNQAAPGDAISLPNAGYDAMNAITGNHNNLRSLLIV